MQRSHSTDTPEAVPRGLVVAAFAAIYVIWGSTYLAIKIAVETLPPFIMAGCRFVLAGSLLYAVCRLRGTPRPERIHWRNAAIIGGLLLLGGNGAVCGVAHLLPSGVSSLLIATTPFWMVVLDWRFAGGPRPSARILLGLVAGFGGLALLLGPGRTGDGGVYIPAALVLLLGALSWSVGSICSRGARLPASKLLAIGMEQVAGGFIMLAVGLLAGEGGALVANPVSARSVAAFLYLVVFGSLLGFTAYIWLLGVSTPARVSTYAYVNPVIAVFLGWALAGEAVSATTLVAAGIIVGAVAVVTLDGGRIARRAFSPKRLPLSGPLLKDPVPSGPLLGTPAPSGPSHLVPAPAVEER